MKWFDKVSDEEIQAMKDNKIQMDLLDLQPGELADLIKQVPRDGSLQIFLGVSRGWEAVDKGGVLCNLPYRLNPNWERSEEENKMKWYDDIIDNGIKAMKENRTPYKLLCAENNALAKLLQDADDHIQYYDIPTGKWVLGAADMTRLDSLVYRLDPNWTRPKEEDKMSEEEDRYMITEKGKAMIEENNKTPQMVKCLSWGHRNNTGCYVIEKNGHELYLTEYEAQTIADQLNSEIMLSEVAADAHKEAEEKFDYPF